MKFVRVTVSDTTLLEKFITGAGSSLRSFRYFDKRPLNAIAQHICTWLIEDNGNAVAYGHLDKEGDTVWLGIAVIEEAKGKGYGKGMMERLMQSAAGCGIDRVRLSVDNDNVAAIALYDRFGFHLVEKKETFGFYEWNAEKASEAAISSLAFTGMKIGEVTDVAEKNNLVLEFSSGMPFDKDAEQIFLAAKCRRFAHNYFPAPEIPFVLNLASSCDEIRNKSIQHCIHGIQLSYEAGAPFFSAHAGFCIDPKPSELGRELSKVDSFDRGMHWQLFISSVREVLRSTTDLPTGFLLENNVLAKMNVYSDGSNPLLNVRAEEMNRMLGELKNPRVGNLIDTAHLKVSAQTLGFDLQKEMQSIQSARCVHHSDNDGMKDDNRPFDESYWFLPFMQHYQNAVHVIEVRKQEMSGLTAMQRLLFNRY